MISSNLNKRSRQASSDYGEYVQVLKKIKQQLDYITELLDVQIEAINSEEKDKIGFPYSHLCILNSHKDTETCSHLVYTLPIASDQDPASSYPYLEDISQDLSDTSFLSDDCLSYSLYDQEEEEQVQSEVDEEEEQESPLSEDQEHLQQPYDDEGLAEVLLLLSDNDELCSSLSTKQDDPILDIDDYQVMENRRDKREHSEDGLTIDGMRSVWKRTQNHL